MDNLGTIVLYVMNVMHAKGISLKINLMISGNYVVIMIVMMSIYVYMYVCMSFHQGLCLFYANMYIYICMYVCCCLTESS